MEDEPQLEWTIMSELRRLSEMMSRKKQNSQTIQGHLVKPNGFSVSQRVSAFLLTANLPTSSTFSLKNKNQKMQFTTLFTMISLAVAAPVPVPGLGTQILGVGTAVGASLIASSMIENAIYSHEAKKDAEKRKHFQQL